MENKLIHCSINTVICECMHSVVLCTERKGSHVLVYSVSVTISWEANPVLVFGSSEINVIYLANPVPMRSKRSCIKFSIMTFCI